MGLVGSRAKGLGQTVAEKGVGPGGLTGGAGRVHGLVVEERGLEAGTAEDGGTAGAGRGSTRALVHGFEANRTVGHRKSLERLEKFGDWSDLMERGFNFLQER